MKRPVGAAEGRRPPSSPVLRPSPFRTVLLFLAIVLALGGLNFRYLFQTELYEHGDLAANSLAIREAKAGTRLYGQYSRWGFYHPGPGWFYVEGAGEALLHDRLHAVPTPWNAQLIAVLLVQAGFLAAALGTLARWVPGRVAVPLGLLFATAHLAALGPTALLNTWTAYVMVPPMAAMLVLGASVAAGRGRDLPLAALAGAALLHAHIAQPGFVFPLLGGAYAGLILRTERFRPWRTFPRAHLLTAGIVALCALPVILDALKGTDGNLAAILAFRREHAAERPKRWADASYYLLRFLTYKPAAGQETILQPKIPTVEMARYARAHAGTLALWAAAFALPAIAGIVGWRGRVADRRVGNDPPAGAGRFLLALWSMVAAAAGLSLLWARAQNGPMFYFNSWFFFGVLLALALLAAASLADLANRLLPRGSASRWTPAVLGLLAAALFAVHADRFRARDGGTEPAHRMARTVAAALAEDPAGRGRVKFLSFGGGDAWEDAVAVALQLARRGEPFRASVGDFLVFGRENSPADPFHGLKPDDLRAWHIVPAALDPGAAARRPLYFANGLQTEPTAVDPVAGTAVTFSGHSPNSVSFTLSGWSWSSPDEPYTWSELREATMIFRAVPVTASADAAVVITLDLFPALGPGRPTAPRLELLLNGEPLAALTISEDAPVTVRVPAARWNAAPDARLTFRFPDAASLRSLGQGDDPRVIGFGFRAVRFGVAGD